MSVPTISRTDTLGVHRSGVTTPRTLQFHFTLDTVMNSLARPQLRARSRVCAPNSGVAPGEPGRCHVASVSDGDGNGPSQDRG